MEKKEVFHHEHFSDKNIISLDYVIRRLTRYQLDELSADKLRMVIDDTMTDKVWKDFADYCKNNDKTACKALEDFMRGKIEEEFLDRSKDDIAKLWIADGFWDEDVSCSQEIEYITFDFHYKGKTYHIDIDYGKKPYFISFRDLWNVPFGSYYLCKEPMMIGLEYLDNGEYFEFSVGLTDWDNPYTFKLYCKHFKEGGELKKDLGCKLDVENFYIGGMTDVIQVIEPKC